MKTSIHKNYQTVFNDLVSLDTNCKKLLSNYHKKFTLLVMAISMAFMVSCVSIPKETVTLSKTLQADMEILQHSHQAMIKMYYGSLKNDVNEFVNRVYLPFVIRFVMQSELDNYIKGQPGLYQHLENNKLDTELLSEMYNFQEAAYQQVESKRKELLQPINEQEQALLKAINQSYQNVLYANTSLSAYLESAQSVRKSQKEAIQKMGLSLVDSIDISVQNALSEQLNELIKKGETIDLNSKEAFEKIEDLTKKIQEITTK